MSSYRVFLSTKRKFIFYMVIAVLSLCMVVGVFLSLERPGVAKTVDGKVVIEDGAEPVVSGTVAYNVKWSLYDDGSGGYALVMEKNNTATAACYVNTRLTSITTLRDYIDQITEIKICDGITSLPADFARKGSDATNNTALKTLDLSECSTIATIGTNAFYRCTTLESVDMSGCSALKTLGTNAFWGNSSLSSIALPDNITTLGNWVFYNCAFTEFPFEKLSNVNSMGTYCFSSCKSLVSADLSGMTEITTIPQSTFNGCTALEMATIPMNATSIVTSAFVNCTALKEVIIPEDNNLASIQVSAFDGCTALQTLDFSKLTKLKSIEGYAFRNCKNIAEVDLSHSPDMTTMGVGVFQNAIALQRVLFHKDNQLKTIQGSTFSGCVALEEVSFENLTQLETIEGSAFINCKALNQVDLSNAPNLKSIGANAFQGTTALTNVMLAENNQIATIGTNAFNGSGVVHFDFEHLNNVTSFGESCFYNCTKLQEADLSNSTKMTAIPKNMFYNCSGMESLTLPSGQNITSVGDSAFRGTAITNFKFDTLANVDTMGVAVFRDCTKLKAADMSAMTRITSIPNDIFYNCTALKKAVLPEGDTLTSIGNNAFFRCTAMVEVDIPEDNNIQSIGSYAFGNNNGAMALREFPFAKLTKLTTIGNNAFTYCSSLQSIDFSENSAITSIGNNAFDACSGIRTVAFENLVNVETIGGSAFKNCSSLRRADLSNMKKLKAIPASMFYSNTALAEVILPEDSAVTSIGDSAFYNCTSLKALDVSRLKNLETLGGANTFLNTKIVDLDFSGTNLTTVASGAFARATSLKTVSFKDTKLTELSATAFANQNNATLAVREIDFSGTPLTEIPADFAKVLKNLEVVDVTGCTALETIGARAFNQCTILESLVGMDTCTALETIGENAFANCSNLESIALNENLKTIGSSAFANCSGLEEINYNNADIETIKADAFEGAGKKNGVTIRVSGDTKVVTAKIFADDVRINEVLFAGENDSLILGKNALKQAGEPLASMSDGTTEYYVDAQGVVYSKDKTTLYYIPPHITTYTLPEAVTTVASGACRLASDLETLVFENITNVTTLQPYAFAYCTTLTEIQSGSDSATTVEAAETLFASATIGGNAFYRTGLQIAETGILTKDTLVEKTKTADDSDEYELDVFIRRDADEAGLLLDDINPATKRIMNMDTPDENIYYYLTNEIGKVSINLSAKGASEDKVCRVYFDSSSNKILYDFQEGVNSISSEGGSGSVEVKFIKVPGTNIHYLEFEAKPGETFGFVSSLYYPNFSVTEGTVKIWSEIVDDADAELKLVPETYQEALWYTAPQSWTVTKTGTNGNTSILKMVKEGEEKVRRFRTTLIYTINSSSNYGKNSDESDTYGVDPVQYLYYEDTMQMPEGITWDPKVIEAVQNGAYGYEAKTGIIYVKIDGVKTTVATIDKTIADTVLTYDENTKNITIGWKVYNSKLASSTAANNKWEMDNVAVKITLNAPDIFYISEDYDVTKRQNMTNKVNQTAYYLYAKEGLTADHTTDFFTKSASHAATYIPISNVANITFGKTLYNVRTDSNSGNLYGSNKAVFTMTAGNDGLVAGNIYTIKDALNKNLQMAGDDIEQCFADTYGKELTITIENGYLQPMTQRDVVAMDNSTVQLHPIDSGAALEDTDKTENFVLTWSTANDCIQVVHGEDTYLVGTGQTYKTIQELWDAIGFLNRWNTQYTCEWTVENTTIESTETRAYRLYATAKTTFEKIQLDRLGNLYESLSTSSENIGNNSASLTGTQNRTASTGNMTWYKELQVDKVLSINGKSISVNEPPKTTMGSDFTFTLRVYKYGHEARDTISLNDEMSGPLAALAPVEGNEDAVLITEDNEEIKLSEAGLDIVTSRKKVLSYVLSRPGTYKNLRIGINAYGETVYADKVVVSRGAEMVTRFYWYYAPSYYAFSDAITYEVISSEDWASPDKKGEYGYGNVEYLNDRPNDRIYDGIAGKIRLLESDKKIVKENAGLKSEVLVQDSSIAQGDEVIYKLKVKNLDETYGKYVSIMYDILPETYGQFAWSKENVSIEVVSNLDTKNTTAQTWRISSMDTAGEEKEGIYYIYWNNKEDTDEDATKPVIYLRGDEELYFYVTLKFPKNTSEEKTWDNFERRVLSKGNQLTNILSVNGDTDTATHTIKVAGEGILQKGVYGIYEQGAAYDDRNIYTYTGFAPSYVSYYVTLYNSGDGRLYLNEITDYLPKGFTFRNLTAISTITGTGHAATTNTLNTTGSSYMQANAINTFAASHGYSLNILTFGYPNANSNWDDTNLLARVNDVALNPTEVEYVSAYVKAAYSTANDKQTLKFTVSKQYGTDTSTQKYASIQYDEDIGKCYLEKGQALVFGYIAMVGNNKITEKVSENTIAMQYYDYGKAGCRLSDKEQVFIQGNYNTNTDSRNDGSANLLLNDEARMVGFSGGDSSSWFQSDVTVRRTSKVVPGVTKMITGRIQSNGVEAEVMEGGICESGDTQQWQMNFYNEGTTLLDTYTVTDTIEAPYYFDGDIGYRMYGDVYADIWSKGGYIRNGTKTQNYENDTLLKGVTFRDSDGYRISKALSEYDKDEIVIEFKTEKATKTDSTFYWTDTAYSVKLGEETQIEFSWISYNAVLKTVYATVLFDVDERGNCIFRLRIDGDNSNGFGYISPDGGYAMMTANTKKPDSVTVYSTIQNKAVLNPEQEFDPEEVNNGTVLYDVESVATAVQGTASFAVKGAYSTTSWKTVTDKSETSNTASSKDTKNYITLLYDDEHEPHCSDVQYGLNVKNLCDTDVIEKMVIIDNLPESGDHTAYGSADATRESQYKMMLKALTEENIYVTNTDTGDVVTRLNRIDDAANFMQAAGLEYTIEFSTETTFDDNDWSGGTATKWMSWDEARGQLENETLSIEEIRSFRVIIGGGDGIGLGNTVTVYLDAAISGQVAREQTAWNNFGYKYDITAHGTTISMSASSLLVGLRTENTPKIKKTMTSAVAGMDVSAKELGLYAEFLVYEGEAIEYSSRQNLLKQLSEQDKEFAILTISGEDIDEGNWMVFNGMKSCKAVKNASGKYEVQSTANLWKWVEKKTYHVTESGMSDDFLFNMMQNGYTNDYTFTYVRDGKYTITCENTYNNYNIKLIKRSTADAESRLENAIFARYQTITGDPEDISYQTKVKQAWKRGVADYIAAVEQLESLDKVYFQMNYIASDRLKTKQDNYESYLETFPTVKKALSNTADVGDDFCQMYTVANADGTETTYYFVDARTTDIDGQISYKGVVEKQFGFVEIAAPEGYTLNHALTRLTRNADPGREQTLEISNTPTVELPMTGETGVASVLMPGMALLLLSMAGVVLHIKRNNDFKRLS